MLWSRKSAPVHDRSRIVGLDLNASRVRGVSVGGGKYRPLLLDDPAEELVLFLACDRRTPEVGRTGYALSRKLPHVVCSNFLPSLARSQEWRVGRHSLHAEDALGISLTKVCTRVEAESEAAALVLPAYLAPDQVARAVVVATRAKLPLKGTATAPLALAASRAAAVLTGKQPANPSDGVVPFRPSAGGPGSVVVVDADEYGLSATVITIDRAAAKLVSTAAWPRLGVRVWKDKLLDAVADRCIRLCRRDPRDSADAEQALFEQLDDALDRARAGQRVSLTVRTAHWYQDLVQPPDEFDGYCSALARAAAEAIRDLAAGTNLSVPPRAVWLTHDAGRLPGLPKAVHQNTPEGTAVEVLPPPAVPLAAAALVPRWLTGELPRTHLDTAVPLERVSGLGSRGSETKPGTAHGQK
jgi:hypothetical protein